MNTFKRILRAEDFTSVWRISVNGNTCELEHLAGFEHIQNCLQRSGMTVPPWRVAAQESSED